LDHRLTQIFIDTTVKQTLNEWGPRRPAQRDIRCPFVNHPSCASHLRFLVSVEVIGKEAFQMCESIALVALKTSSVLRLAENARLRGAGWQAL
jgi:hypothetical protein